MRFYKFDNKDLLLPLQITGIMTSKQTREITNNSETHAYGLKSNVIIIIQLFLGPRKDKQVSFESLDSYPDLLDLLCIMYYYVSTLFFTFITE